jgi:hypothetical protein
MTAQRGHRTRRTGSTSGGSGSGGERGQAAVELAGLLPLLAVIALAAYAMLAGLSAGEQAGVAAEAGAIALLQDRDPAAAAREALPDDVRRSSPASSAHASAPTSARSRAREICWPPRPRARLLHRAPVA